MGAPVTVGLRPWAGEENVINVVGTAELVVEAQRNENREEIL